MGEDVTKSLRLDRDGCTPPVALLQYLSVSHCPPVEPIHSCLASACKLAILFAFEHRRRQCSSPLSCTYGTWARACGTNALQVKDAMRAVASIHGHMLEGKQNAQPQTRFWARQAAGEGAHLKKWRIIIRNLPFNVRFDVVPVLT